ncbi:hypothetical protein EGM88_15730 [Aureibaculum marinum]|uniref:Uncharacterized protein n=1 Tax=Aureibaculum marinum TaxID=2487930 RepID=A0A3N4N7C6_9FLAO|nr:hypothetical protein [Aureibaculum marinum]RPD90067.1 hypothetical protein EGM88_15730 [Aureibaculum marinum]
MRTLTITIIYLISLNVFSQKIKTQYFFINEKDSLIQKQESTKENKFQGYKIINEDRIIKEYIRSSKIDADDIEIDVFDSLSFTYNEKNDIIVTHSFIKNLNIIRTRKEFFKRNVDFDETKNRFIFIIPIKCNKYILRKVRPLISE